MARRQNEDLEMIKSFAETIDSYIVNNKLTNKAFGDLLNVDEATIRKYRKGEALPSHEQMKKITLILGMHYHEIMGYEDPAHKA